MTTRTEALALYPTPAFVRGGEVVPVEGRRTLRVIDPATGHDLGEFPSATREDIEEALRLSERGFTAWRTLPVTDRAAILVLAADNLLARKARLAALVTLELGKPFREALAEVEVAAGMFRFAGEEARRSYGRQIPARESLTLQLTVREPVGPVAAFASWNAPLITPSRKISSALAAGCSVVLKASEQTPACAVEVARAVIDAGAPEGAVSVLFGEPQSIAGALLESPVIRAVTFTGSIPIGREIAARAAHSMKRQVMELGGHAPVIVFDDVDVEAVVASAVPAKYRNSGQVCTSPTRFIVQSGIYARFVEAFAARAAQVKIGDGFEPATDMGPLAHRGRIATTEDLVADARTRGLRIAAGGRRGEGPGCFYQPTVIADAGIDARAVNEEPFGPIATFMSFETFEEALYLANRLPVGLAAYIMTNRLDLAKRAALGIEAGTVNVNGFRASLPETPFGGHKDSGVGREGGIEGIEAFQNVKLVTLT